MGNTKAKKVLTAEAILSADDKRIVSVEVPEWGGIVYLRTITGRERDEFESAALDASKRGDLRGLRAFLLALCICNEDGERIFKDDDAPKLAQKNAAVLDRLFTRAQELNALTERDINEIQKN